MLENPIPSAGNRTIDDTIDNFIVRIRQQVKDEREQNLKILQINKEAILSNPSEELKKLTQNKI